MNHLDYAYRFVQEDDSIQRAIAHALIAIAEQLEKMNDTKPQQPVTICQECGEDYSTCPCAPF